MIDRHYIRTINRYVDELASKNALIVHTGATPALLRQVALLSKTVMNLAEHALMETEGAAGSTTVGNAAPWLTTTEGNPAPWHVAREKSDG